MMADPWQLPKGWKWSTVGDLASLIQSGFAHGKKASVNGDLLHLRPYNVGLDGEIDLSQQFYVPKAVLKNGDACLEAGDVLFNNTNSVELVGKTAIVRNSLSAAFSNHITLIKTRKDRCEGTWLALVLRALWQTGFFAQRCNKWIGQAGYNTTALKDTPIPIPPTIEDQQRIVAKIEVLFDRIREAKRLRRDTSSDTGILMASALFDVFVDLGSSCRASTIKQLRDNGKLQIYGGGTPSTKNAAFWKGPLPWVSPKDMKRWEIHDSEDHISNEAVSASSVKLLPAGAVLIVVRGMILEKAWPIAITRVEVTINQDMKALVPSDGLLPEFLAYVLRFCAPEVLQRIEIAGHGTRRLRTAVLESLEVPIPTLSEQESIVKFLNQIAETVTVLLKQQDQTAMELQLAEESILDRAFRGEL